MFVYSREGSTSASQLDRDLNLGPSRYASETLPFHQQLLVARLDGERLEATTHPKL